MRKGLTNIRHEEMRWSRPVSRVLSRTVIPLGAPSPVRSSNLPVSRAGHASGHLFGLASSGVCRTGLLPDSWCALAAPFHPCLIPPSSPPEAVQEHFVNLAVDKCPRGHRAIGGLLSVALSVGSRRPGVTWHSALRSPDFPPPPCGGSDRPADSGAELTGRRPRTQGEFFAAACFSAWARS